MPGFQRLVGQGSARVGHRDLFSQPPPGGTSITPAQVQCSMGSLTPVRTGEIQHPFIKGSGMQLGVRG